MCCRYYEVPVVCACFALSRESLHGSAFLIANKDRILITSFRNNRYEIFKTTLHIHSLVKRMSNGEQLQKDKRSDAYPDVESQIAERKEILLTIDKRSERNQDEFVVCFH